MPHAVAVLCIAPEGIPLVRDSRKVPPYWKLPGGKGEGGETAEETARRELEEETGIKVPVVEDFQPVGRESRKAHMMYFFLVYRAGLDGLKSRGDEGEEVRIATADEILEMGDFFPPHRDAVRDFLIQNL